MLHTATGNLGSPEVGTSHPCATRPTVNGYDRRWSFCVIRKSSLSDLPAVLEVLAENKESGLPGETGSSRQVSEQELATWNRMMMTHDLTVYLAEIGDCFKIQLLSHKRHAHDGAHRLYRSLGFEPEAEGFRLYLGEAH